MDCDAGLSTTIDIMPRLDAATDATFCLANPEANSDRWLRALDIALAVILLVLIMPVLVLIALAIKCTSTGPVIFAQKRLGRRAHISLSEVSLDGAGCGKSSRDIVSK